MYVPLKDADTTCALKSLREKIVGNFSYETKKGEEIEMLVSFK